MDLETYLAQAGLQSEALSRISGAARARSLRRNEPLLREGEICRHKVFVVEGLLRTLQVSDDGSEHILQFTTEGGWTLDPESYDLQVPARVSICAVEPSTVLLWSKPDFQELLTSLPDFRRFAEGIIQQNIHSSRQRILSALSATPEAKYDEFVRQFPGLLARLPLRMIAAYLGISLKTLTRIRHAQYGR